MSKSVAMTGASRGFGRDASLLLESKGWNVPAPMGSPEKGESWAKGAPWLKPRLDVTDAAAMKAAIDPTIQEFGGVDVHAPAKERAFLPAGRFDCEIKKPGVSV